MPVTLLAPAEVESALATWRAMHRPLDLLLSHLPPDQALRQFGIGLWQAGQTMAAIHVLTAAATLAPEDAAIWRDLANAYSATGKQDEAQFAIEMSIARDEGQPHAWLLLATILNGAHKYPAAEQAFRRALELEPSLAEASFGLGILFFQQQKFAEAIDCLRRASHAGCHNVGLYVCLGQALFLNGRFLEAADAFARAARFEPNDAAIVEKIALLQFIKTVIEDDVAAAIAAYRDVMGERAGDIDALVHKVFYLLGAYDYREAAVKLGRAWLALAPDDPVRRFMLAAATGEAIDHAPADYVTGYFDRFAEGFDNQLRRVLHYRVPEELHALLAGRERNFTDILDLGCGTGLAAQFLRSFECSLTGVDLSPAMLEKARQRNLYDELVRAEAVSFLQGKQAAFDLVFAADVVIYFGNLRELYAGVAKSLRAGGLFAFSIETGSAGDYVLQPSGRFAHNLAYVEALAQMDFAVDTLIETTIRLEANRPVRGALVILRRLEERGRQEQTRLQNLAAPAVRLRQ